MAEFRTETIELGGRQDAYALLGKGDELLKLLKENFACRFVTRGAALTVEGETEEVAAAKLAVTELLALAHSGTTIAAHEARYAIRLARANEGKKLHELFSRVLMLTPAGKAVRPQTLGQMAYLDAIRRHAVTIAHGPAGSGKTFLAVAMAVLSLRAHEVERIVLTRPAVEAGERLGFLPGDMSEKVDPYLRPLYDSLNELMGYETYQKLLAKNVIEIAPLAYMRGRTLSNAFVILDEGQNTTGRQMKMFLTRLGFGSKMVVTGDPGQADLPRGVASGLTEALTVLDDVKGVGIVELSGDDIVRHDVVSRIVRAYENYAKETEL